MPMIAPIGISLAGRYYVPAQVPRKYTISGTTRDANGNALANCSVEIYENMSNLFRGTVISNASGVYSMDVTSSETGLTFYAVAYLAGSPDVFGTTANTLVGS